MTSPTFSSQPTRSTPDADEVRLELERVLNSSMFRGSKRCQDFLRYVVTEVLEGNAKNLKERTLAIEVFGRSPNENLSDVSIVRVGAREVRKRLAQYYVHDGTSDPVRVDLPAGSYIPVFEYRATEPASAPVEEPLQAAQPLTVRSGPQRRRRMWRIACLLASLSAIAVAIVLWRWVPRSLTPFDAFWQPALQQRTPIEILLAHPIAYHPSSHATELDRKLNGKAGDIEQRVIHVPPGSLNGSDFVPAIDQYVGFGDTIAAVRLTSLFVQRHSNTRVRLADRVEFNDLFGSSVVLIGAYTNRWTAELTKRYRFQFSYDGSKPCIYDSQTSRRFTLTKTDNGRSEEDYIVVCRLPHLQTIGFVIVCAGLNIYGTEEGGRILAEPTLLNPILKNLPSGWAKRNLQLILHVEVVGDAPALPEVVAVHTW